MSESKTALCLYTVTLPLSGAAVLQFRAVPDLSDTEAIERAKQGSEDADLAVMDGGFLMEVQDWEMHSSAVSFSDFPHPVPEVRREEE